MGYTLMRRTPTRREPFDETTPDGTPVMDIGLPEGLRRLLRRQPSVTLPSAVVETPPVVETVAQPTPDYMPGAALQDSYGGDLARPVRTFSAESPVADLPTTPLPPLRRTLALAPAVQTIDDGAALQPISPEALALKRRFTRPELANTGDPRADLTRHATDLEGWRNPADRNGRLKSFGLGALRGLVQGLATGGLGGAIGGALAGGVHGAVSPNLDERESRDEELARTYGQLGRMNKVADADLKRREGIADITLKEANAQRALREPVVKPNFQLKDAVDGSGVVAIDMNDPTKPPVKVPGARGTAADYEIHDDGTKVQAINRHNPRDRFDLSDVNPKPRPQMVQRTLEDGTVVSVPATTALTQEATIKAADITAGNQYGNQSYEDTVRQIDKENAALQERHKAAGAAVAELRAAIKAGQEAAAKVRNPPVHRVGKEVYGAEPEEIARYREEYDKAQSLVNSLGQSIRQNYGEFVDDDPDMKLPILLKAAPTPKAYPQRQAPQRRSAAVAPRASTPSAPKPVSAQSTEQEVREAARYYGRDEEAAVAKWRKLQQ